MDNNQEKNKQFEKPGDEELPNILEVILFASAQPVTLKSMVDLVPGTTKKMWQNSVHALEHKYIENGSGLRLRKIAGGYEIATNSKYESLIRKFLKKERKRQLSNAALETLAIVAYQQPVTASEIEEIRGVNVMGVLKTLLEKHLIKTLGRRKIPGRPFLYGTTKYFLRHFGLPDLKDLPKMEEMKDFLKTENNG